MNYLWDPPLGPLDQYMHFEMRPLPGTYALVFASLSVRPIGIGKLGTLKLEPGFYVYVGSAFGPGGLKARIEHHREKTSCPHWHVDYISEHLRLDEIWYTCDLAHREHQWARILARARGANVPLSGFGSSDCHCKSHLYFFNSRPCGRYFRRKIRSSIDDHDRIFINCLSAKKPTTAFPPGFYFALCFPDALARFWPL